MVSPTAYPHQHGKYNNNPTLLKGKRCVKFHIYFEFNRNLWKNIVTKRQKKINERKEFEMVNRQKYNLPFLSEIKQNKKK